MTAAVFSLLLHMVAMVFFMTAGTATGDGAEETSLAWFSLIVGCILTWVAWLVALGWLP